jgi:hypothetical protein
VTALSRSVTEPRARRRGFSFYAASGLVVCAVIAGLVIGGFAVGGGDPPTSRTATPARATVHDGVRLQVPGGWARADVVKVPGFKRPLGLRNPDAGLRAVVERLPATSATLLPAAFLATLERAPEKPELVRLAAGRHAWRYRFPGRDGSMTLFYAAPTTSGIATVACTSPIDANIPPDCAALAAAVTVPGSRPLAPSMSAGFLSRLPTVVSDLEAARAKGVDALAGAERARGQALAADELGRAHKAAATALAPLASGNDKVPRATVGALTATASALTTLASAARSRLPGPYGDAGRAVTTADADLRKALAKVAVATRTATQAASTPVGEPAAPARTEPKEAAKTKAPAKTQPKAASKTKAQPKRRSTAKSRPAERSAPKPAAKRRDAERAVKAPAAARPAATAAGGTDLTLLIIVLSSAVALFFGIRGARRALR